MKVFVVACLTWDPENDCAMTKTLGVWRTKSKAVEAMHNAYEFADYVECKSVANQSFDILVDDNLTPESRYVVCAKEGTEEKACETDIFTFHFMVEETELMLSIK